VPSNGPGAGPAWPPWRRSRPSSSRPRWAGGSGPPGSFVSSSRAELGESRARTQGDRALKLASERERLARRQFANYQLRQARAEHEAGRDEPARALLESARQAYGSAGEGGFAWSYLHRQASRRLEVLFGHEAEVRTLAFSPDGRVLASGDRRGAVRFWDLASGRAWAAAQPHRAPVLSLAFSPDGKTLASAGHDYPCTEVIVHDVASGRRRGMGAAAKLKWEPYDLWFSADGRRLVLRQPTPDDENILCWRLPATSEGPLRLEASGDEALRVAGLVDPRLQALAGVLDGEGTGGGEIERTWMPPYPRGLAFAWNRNMLVVGFGDGSFEVRPHDENRTYLIGRFNPSRPVFHLRHVRPEPAVVLPADPPRHLTLKGLVAPGVGFPGATLVSSGDERDRSCLTPDGSTLAVWRAEDRTLRMMDTTTGRERAASRVGDLDRVTTMACSPDGTFLAFGPVDRRIRLWRLAPVPLRGHAPKEVWSVAWTRDGRTLASCGDDHMIRLWDPATGRERAILPGHGSLVAAIAASPDGATLASAGFDGTVRLWDVAGGTARAVLRGHADRVRALAWSPDGRRLASAGEDATVRLWDPATGLPVGGPLREDILGRSDALAWSPDGRTLATCGIDATVRLWDTATGQETLTLTGPECQINGMAFDPGGGTLAAAYHDGAVRLWRGDPCPRALPSR
jgi:WD40 repeat protein